MARARMTDGTTVHVHRAGTQPAQWLAALVALALLVLGIVGFSRTGVTDWSSSNSATVIGLHLTAGRSLVYVIAGVVGALLALLAGTSRLYGWLLVIGFGALLLWGLALVGTFATNPVSALGDPLRLETSDNWWHAGGLVLGLIVAVLPARRTIVADAPVDGERSPHRHRAEDRVEEPVERPVERPVDAGMEPMPEAQNTEEPTRRAHWWSPSRRDPGYR